MRFERAFWWALAIALGVHAGAALVIRLQQAPRLPGASRGHLDVLEVSLLDSPEAALAETPPRAEPEGVATAEHAASRRVLPATPSDGVVEPVRPKGGEDVPEAPATSPSAGGETPGPVEPRTGLSLDAIGLGGSNPFLGMKGLGDGVVGIAPPPAASTEVPNRTRVAEQRLKRFFIVGMLEHDRAVGAARGGAVAMVLHDAAMLVSSPVNGQAEFVATVDAAGLVTALSPTRVSSDLAAWRNVAALALKQLASKRLRVPAGAAGLEVRLALSSKIQLPSGSASGPSVHLPPLLSADGTRLTRLDLPPESAQLPDRNGPGALGAPLMRQPVPGGGIDGDLSDIGGISRRVVYVTIADERPL